MSACVLVSWAPEATEKSTRIPTPTNRLNSARGSHHTLPDRPRSTASRISRSLCKLRRIRPNQAGQPISGRALRKSRGTICSFAEPVMVEKNVSELSVRLINGSKVRLHGADNPDRLRGGYLDGCGSHGDQAHGRHHAGRGRRGDRP